MVTIDIATTAAAAVAVLVNRKLSSKNARTNFVAVVQQKQILVAVYAVMMNEQ